MSIRVHVGDLPILAVLAGQSFTMDGRFWLTEGNIRRVRLSRVPVQSSP